MPDSNIAVLPDQEVDREAGVWVKHQVLRSSTCAKLPNSEKVFDEDENFGIMEAQDTAFQQALSNFDVDY